MIVRIYFCQSGLQYCQTTVQFILEPLIAQTKCTLEQAQEASQQLDLSWRQVYTLLKRYRNYDKQLLALIPQKPTGGKEKTRIPCIAEQIIQIEF